MGMPTETSLTGRTAIVDVDSRSGESAAKFGRACSGGAPKALERSIQRDEIDLALQRTADPRELLQEGKRGVGPLVRHRR